MNLNKSPGSTISSLEHPIQEDDKVFFLHIPKTAGTSLATIVETNFDPDDRAPFMFLYDTRRGIPQSVINECRYYRGHLHYNIMRDLLGHEPVCLTMLRDPVERYISDFANMQRVPAPAAAINFQRASQTHALLSQMTLAEFVDNTLSDLARLTKGLQNRQIRMIAARIRLKSGKGKFPIVVEDDTPPEILLARARKRLDNFAFYGLAERFQDSLFLLAYTFGWPPVVGHQLLNVAPHRPRQENLNAPTLKRLQAINKLDQALYEYAHELFQARFEQMTHELLERYSEHSHAHLKPPFSNEVMVELLEKHYERRFSEQQQPLRSVDLIFEQIIPGSGWHYPEEHPEHGIYRWTGPGTRSTLHFLFESNPGDMQIEFTVLAAITANMIETLSLVVNNHPITLEKTHDKNGQVFCKGYLPAIVLAKTNGFIRLVFLIDCPIAPSTLDANNPDDRPLGVAINRLQIQSANSMK